jgi:cysteine-rich repeat protein
VQYQRRPVITAILASLAALAACGDNVSTSPDATSGPPDASDGCTAVALGAQDFQANLFGQLTGVRYAIAPAIDGALPEALLVELYDSTTGGLPPLVTGTFALGVGPNGNLGTCQHCVWIPVDWDELSPLGTVFVATEGTITLTAVEDPLSPVFAGSTSEIVLREATIDDTGASVLVDGGRCLRAPAIEFDTHPTTGATCLSAEDCGNPILEVCSPATGTCGPPECGDFLGCPSDRPVCISQYGQLFEGACYADCDPTGDDWCGDSAHVCQQLGVDPAFGICLLAGDGSLGEACPLEDIATSCMRGMTCAFDAEVCTRTCNFFDADPGCQTDHVCDVLGVCAPETSGDPADFGDDCAATAELAQGCASDGTAFRGICFSYFIDEPLECQEACLGDQGCEPEEFCALRFSSGLGVCLPDPVCGDGELGEIGETCDDGNTMSGDGCSGDCQTVEYNVICPSAPALAVGANPGDTSAAWDGFQASCQLGLARAEVYRFVPPSRGRLRLTVDAPTLHSMSVRTDCDEPASEAACSTNDPFGAAEVIYQVTNLQTRTVLVSAFTVLEEGPYTLHAEFVPESCGDGVTAGLEVCDDGNTMSNDGCRADCRAIEYGVYCNAAPDLVTTADGDNTGAPNVYAASCSNFIFGSGPERLYAFTAPSAGTARFRLQPADIDDDLALAVFDDCGQPATMTELGCSSVTDVEQVDVEVTAGQTLTVLVEGFDADDLGAYTVTAQMLP